jgi:hypothetical protein
VNSSQIKLASLLQGAGVGWVLHEGQDERTHKILAEIEEVDRYYQEAFGQKLVPSLWEQMSAHSGNLKPLIQSFASPMTPPIRTMIYCVLSGASVRSVRYDYEAQRKSTLSVAVRLPSGKEHMFESDELWDAEVLRHFGFFKKGGRPIIDGYYAFRE